MLRRTADCSIFAIFKNEPLKCFLIWKRSYVVAVIERKMKMKKVAIIMGSDSDLPVIRPAFDILKKFGVEFVAHIYSAHRTPRAAESFGLSSLFQSLRDLGSTEPFGLSSSLQGFAPPFISQFRTALAFGGAVFRAAEDFVLSSLLHPSGFDR